ncbi:hypothetical protein IU433_24195 [Nocardia puris]|uniref:DUF7144 domain-containing protein n=1 Tax=Nocardia puris TaxID=208602 RepID=A0A366DIT9_9NOCA|nr:hypothetical protein [Nocardia puris]MBF6213236.1 hypothetical protein [Nocardia puris]MBF6369828.1 hypothetical protein [Nocardia puris]MBF6462115.1 hypothetical protein [Nocardia puris]RBO89419.1 hypothetical protein DFR74_10797 [Nocardia puris]
MAYAAQPQQQPVGRGIAAVVSVMAASFLLAAGLLSLFQGISAVADDRIFTAAPRYLYRFDVTTWGWIHVALGGLFILTAAGLLVGRAWARVIAIVLAALSIVGNFLWLPYYPWWSVTVIVLDVVVIWALSTWRPDQM